MAKWKIDDAQKMFQGIEERTRMLTFQCGGRIDIENFWISSEPENNGTVEVWMEFID